MFFYGISNFESFEMRWVILFATEMRKCFAALFIAARRNILPMFVQLQHLVHLNYEARQ